MSRVLLLLALPVALTGCTSLHNPLVRADFFETSARSADALDGNEAAFDRLAQLQQRWAARGAQGWAYKLQPWDRANRDRAARVAAEVERITAAREAVLSQRELATVMVNALHDMGDEFDSILETLEQGEDTSPATLRVIADQKYLTQRIDGSLVRMATADMGDAVEAADLFGRDVNRFRQLLDAASNGDEELGIDPPSDAGIEDSLAQIDELFNDYVADSAPDVLENVVSRYDAWLARGELTALSPTASGKAKKSVAAKTGKEAAPAAGEEEEPAADPGVEDDAADDGAADEAGADPAEDADMPEDAPPDDDLQEEDVPEDEIPEDEAAAPI